MACIAWIAHFQMESEFQTNPDAIHYASTRSLTSSSRAVSRVVRSEKGKKIQERVYNQVSKKLESIQPGIFQPIPVS